MMYERRLRTTKYKAVAGMFSLALTRAAPGCFAAVVLRLEFPKLCRGADSTEHSRQD